MAAPPGQKEERGSWMDRARSLLPAFNTEAFVDQVLMRDGSVNRTGWLTCFDPGRPKGARLFFVLRGRSLTCFDSEMMEDAGRRVVTLPGTTVWGPLPQRTISLSGNTYSVGPGFTTHDSKGAWLEFECMDGMDAEEWVREIADKEGVTRKHNPGASPPRSDGPGPKEEGRVEPPVPESPSKFTSAPFVSGGDGAQGEEDEYFPKDYVGGSSILEPQVLLESDLNDKNAKWRCWPSGPLPPNTTILGTDQNMRTWDERANVVDVAAETPDQCGIGVGLKHAYQGIELEGGKFSVQISEIASGGTAEKARQDGKIRCGDFLLAVDGWSTSQQDITEGLGFYGSGNGATVAGKVCGRIVGAIDTQVTITVARMVGPHRFFGQPNIWFQMGIVKLSLWEYVTDPLASLLKPAQPRQPGTRAHAAAQHAVI